MTTLQVLAQEPTVQLAAVCFTLLCYCVNLSLRIDRIKSSLPFARIDSGTFKRVGPTSRNPYDAGASRVS
jgi:hypothetical protein